MGALDRLGYAELAQKLKPYIVPWVTAGAGGAATGGPGVGIATHALNGPYHTGILAQSQAPWALSQAAGDARYLMATRQVIAGAGLTGGGVLTLDVQLDVGAGPGITVAADTVALASSVAGSGLTFATGVLAVGAGAGIAVNADDVALASSVAGAGLGFSAGVLSVGVANTGAAGLSAEADLVRLTSSSNPGAAAAVLASDASGYLTLVRLIATDRLRSPLLDTASGDLVLAPASGAVKLAAGGLVQSNSFASGFAGNGFRFDDGVSQAGKASGELDNLTVRGLLRVYELLISKIRTGNGSYQFSDGGKVASVTGVGPYTLNFDEDHGLAANDLIRAQKFLGGAYTSSCTVTSVPTTKQAVVTLNSGNAPAAGYEYVRIGNTTDSSRRGSVYVTSNDSNAPYLDVIDGISSHTDWGTAGKVRVRLGRLSGIAGGSGYGLFAGDNGAAWATVDAVSGFRAGYSGTTRFQVDTSGNLRLYNNLGATVIALDSNGNSAFEGVMTVGTGGEIRQGTGLTGTQKPGDAGANYTGLRIWRDTGVGRIAGYNANTLQWSAGTDGKLHFGSDNGLLDVAGIALVAAAGWSDLPAALISWYSTPSTRTGLVGRIGAGTLDAFGTTGMQFYLPGTTGSGYDFYAADDVGRYRLWHTGNLSSPATTGGNTFTGAQTINSNSQLLTLNGTNHAYIGFNPRNTGRKGYIGFGTAGAGDMFMVQEETNGVGNLYLGTNSNLRLAIHYDGRIAMGANAFITGEAVTLNGVGTNYLLGVHNANGYVQIGPNNGAYNHFITDRPYHWFNTSVSVNGFLSSYMQDLDLRRDGTQRIVGYTWGTYVTAHLTMEDVFAMLNVQAAEPAAPTTGVKIYLQASGGNIYLRAKFANTRVKDLANNI